MGLFNRKPKLLPDERMAALHYVRAVTQLNAISDAEGARYSATLMRMRAIPELTQEQQREMTVAAKRLYEAAVETEQYHFAVGPLPPICSSSAAAWATFYATVVIAARYQYDIDVAVDEGYQDEWGLQKNFAQLQEALATVEQTKAIAIHHNELLARDLGVSGEMLRQWLAEVHPTVMARRPEL